jgi:uncharacterized protein (DUF2164 family)
MDLDYMQKYTDIRIGKLSFNQFMEFINEIYCLGHENGSLTAQSELLKRVNGQMASGNASCGATQISYESVF